MKNLIRILIGIFSLTIAYAKIGMCPLSVTCSKTDPSSCKLSTDGTDEKWEFYSQENKIIKKVTYKFSGAQSGEYPPYPKTIVCNYNYDANASVSYISPNTLVPSSEADVNNKWKDTNCFSKSPVQCKFTD